MLGKLCVSAVGSNHILCMRLQVLDMLHRYEQVARQRSELTEDIMDEELELPYFQTDAVLFDAEMFSLPLVFFDARMRRANCSGGLSVEFRRCLWVPHDRDVTSEAYWQFIPHQTRYNRFTFDHVSAWKCIWLLCYCCLMDIILVDSDYAERFHHERFPVPVRTRANSDAIHLSVGTRETNAW